MKKRKNMFMVGLLFIIIMLLSILIYNLGKEKKMSENDLIKLYYETETTTLVSPHSLRVKMDQGINDYILVDLRSYEEYEKEHIIGAINIPAYLDPYTPSYDEKRLVEEFKKLTNQKETKNKEIIVYCYSTYCMTGRKVGQLLAKNNIFVKHLKIGWNEWRYNWKAWNHEVEWNYTDVNDYIYKGKEPGEPKKRDIKSFCGFELGC